MRLDSVNSRDAHSGDGHDNKNTLYTVVNRFFFFVEWKVSLTPWFQINLSIQ